MEIYCFGCNLELCSFCALDLHKDHQIEIIEKLKDKIKEEIKSSLNLKEEKNNLKKILLSNHEEITQLENNLKFLRTEQETLNQKIKEIDQKEARINNLSLKELIFENNSQILREMCSISNGNFIKTFQAHLGRIWALIETKNELIVSGSDEQIKKLNFGIRMEHV